MMKRNNSFVRILAVFAMVMALMSCGGAREFVYLNDMEPGGKYPVNLESATVVHTNDRLDIKVSCKNPELAADFLGSTFGGSVELYETIISCGALATYLPAADSAVYGEAVDFYGGDAVYSKIVEYSGKTPSNNTGVYYYEARDAAAVAITNIVAGADVDAEIANAEQTVNFAIFI